jgi:CDP-diacylglycerol--serine O-phosphatidyltransferase
MNDFRQIFPGIFTIGNLFCGFASILSSVRGENPEEAAWLIIFAGFFDFLDGIVARLSKADSAFGIQLDSLTDIVSFGVAPTVMLISYEMIQFGNYGWIIGFTFLMAGVFRLARYNISSENESKTVFVGLPIPMAAAALASFVIFSQNVWGEIRLDRELSIMVILFSALMVSTIQYETIPVTGFSAKKYKIKVLVLIAAGILIALKAGLVLFPLVALYVLSGLYKLVAALISKFADEKEKIDEV